jgi:SPP1 gp7 family putative phage head morphogenesis protein
MPTPSLSSSIPEPPTDPRELDAWLGEQAERLAAETIAALVDVVMRAYARFAETLVAAGDWSQFDTIPVEWDSFVDGSLVEGYTGMYLAGNVSAFVSSPLAAGVEPWASRGWARIVNDNAVAYAADARNRLVGVGSTAYNNVKSVVQDGITQGWSTEDVSKGLQDALRFSEYRGEMVARTETMTAYNAGNHAGQKALGEYGPVAKEWLATGDARTRPSHADAMAQGAIPVDDPFQVGDAEMQFPGDDGPPEEVINCRCTVLYYYRGDETLNGDIVGDETFLEENADDPFVVRSVLALRPGQRVAFGGGAADRVVVRRPRVRR